MALRRSIQCTLGGWWLIDTSSTAYDNCEMRLAKRVFLIWKLLPYEGGPPTLLHQTSTKILTLSDGTLSSLLRENTQGIMYHHLCMQKYCQYHSTRTQNSFQNRFLHSFISFFCNICFLSMRLGLYNSTERTMYRNKQLVRIIGQEEWSVFPFGLMIVSTGQKGSVSLYTQTNGVE